MPPPLHVQQIEQTGKRWKGLQLAGAIGMFGGIVLMAIGCAGMLGPVVAIGAIAFVLGIPITIVGRIGGWWHHG